MPAISSLLTVSTNSSRSSPVGSTFASAGAQASADAIVIATDGGMMNCNPAANSIYRDVTRAALLGLVINFGLGVAKLVGGLFGNSFALLSDSVNSLGDTISTVVVLYALRLAQSPPDDKHPYGHTRAEAIAASNVSILIMLSALAIGWQSLQRLTQVHDFPEAWTLWIAGANVLIKEGLYRYYVRVGKRTGSLAIVANAWDHRADALCALAVLVGLAAVRWGGAAFMWADEGAALVVVVGILWSATELFRNSANGLLDVQASPDQLLKIRNVAEATAGVLGVETLRVRKSGLEYFVDIHIEVDPQMSVATGHQIGHLVKSRLMEKFDTVRDVLVHLEPFEE